MSEERKASVCVNKERMRERDTQTCSSECVMDRVKGSLEPVFILVERG